MQSDTATDGAAGFVASNPGTAFALLAVGSLLLAAAPVLLVRRFIVVPHPSDEILHIRPRAWLRALVDVAFPALLLVIFAIAVRLGLHLAERADTADVTLAVALALILTLPLAGVFWAMRALFAAGVRATEGGVFLQGSFVAWSDVARIRRTGSGVVLETPAGPLMKRRKLPALAWELSEEAVDTLERLCEGTRQAGRPPRSTPAR